VQAAVEDITQAVPHVAWSLRIERDGAVLADIDAAAVRPTASMGKVLLLAEVARQASEGRLDLTEVRGPAPDDLVADSGLWQHLTERELSLASMAVLVAAVSDNIAANVLLRQVGLTAVQQASADLGMPQTRMLDRIRDSRGPGDPAMPSAGRASDLARLMSLIASGDAFGPVVSGVLAGWLSLNTDLSMVAGALGADPLAHAASDGGVRLFNKTGTDAGVRADAGHVSGANGAVSYAVIATWEPGRAELVLPVLGAMRAIGDLIVLPGAGWPHVDR